MQAERALAALTSSAPLTILTAKQNTIQHPLVGTANKAMSDMVRYAAEFGMTPSSRSGIRTTNQSHEDSADHFFAS
jgi:phage terminase small subunit